MFSTTTSHFLLTSPAFTTIITASECDFYSYKGQTAEKCKNSYNTFCDDQRKVLNPAPSGRDCRSNGRDGPRNYYCVEKFDPNEILQNTRDVPESVEDTPRVGEVKDVEEKRQAGDLVSSLLSAGQGQVSTSVGAALSSTVSSQLGKVTGTSTTSMTKVLT